jgi:hypothetical protein
MRGRVERVACAALLWGLIAAAPASAEQDANILAVKTNVFECVADVFFRVQDGGDYFVNMWDDGTFRAGAGTTVPKGGTGRVRFTIGGPILESAAGIGVYVEDGVGPSATTTYDAKGAVNGWSPALGNACQTQGKTFAASAVSEEFPVGTKLVLVASLGPTKPRALTLLAKDARIAIGRGPASPDDPVTNGGSLRVLSEGGAAFDDTYPLPADGWKYASAGNPAKGYSFSDQLGKVTVKTGKQIKISAKSELLGHELTPGPDAVIIELRLGERRYCFRFGGNTTYIQDRSFTALNAPPDEISCPK